MFINNFDPVALTVFSLEIRWYSLAYISGILFGWLILKKFLGKEEQKFENVEDLLTYIIFGIILGGRLGYVIFYNFEYYSNNIFEIIMIWKGGMSFHGGLIGVILATIFFCKKNKYNPYIFLDLISLVSPIGIFFGRIANYLNSELYGKVTNVPWSVIFVNIDNSPRHPSQLYEASFEAPYKLIGFEALSVDNAITFFTLFLRAARITFSAPLIFVLIHSIGLYSAAGTCFKAAA